MTKEMIISSNGHETIVAILEDDLVAEVFVERERSRGVVGNVYKGRVSKVLPGMQSSFIDIGLERDGFLYVAEVVDTLDEFERLAGDEDEDRPDPAKEAAKDVLKADGSPDAPGRPASETATTGESESHAPSPKSRTCSRKVRKSSSRSSKSRSAPRAPA